MLTSVNLPVALQGDRDGQTLRLGARGRAGIEPGVGEWGDSLGGGLILLVRGQVYSSNPLLY